MLDTELETHNIYKTYDVCSRQVKIHDRFYQTHRRCKDLVDHKALNRLKLKIN